MRLLIILVLAWVAFSLPLALLAGRALRSRARTPTLAEEVEDYLRGGPRTSRPALAGFGGLVLAAIVAAAVGAGARSDLPKDAIVTLAQWHEQVFPQTTTTAAPPPPVPAVAPAIVQERRADLGHRDAPDDGDQLLLAAPPTTLAQGAPTTVAPASPAMRSDEPEREAMAARRRQEAAFASDGGEDREDREGPGDGDGNGDERDASPGERDRRRAPSTTTTSTTSSTTTSTTSTTQPPRSTTTTSTTSSTMPADERGERDD